MNNVKVFNKIQNNLHYVLHENGLCHVFKTVKLKILQ